jgi:hypothetical protein
MRFIPANCYLSKRALFSSLWVVCLGACFSGYSAYNVLTRYLTVGEFHGGKHGEFISYGIDAAIPAYGLSLTYALGTLYSVYFIICSGVYLYRNNFLMNSKKLNLFACPNCLKALPLAKIENNSCTLCNAQVIELHKFINENHKKHTDIDFSLIPQTAEVSSTWDTANYIFNVLCAGVFMAFVLWAYHSGLFAL